MASVEQIVGQLNYEQTKSMFASCLVNLNDEDVIAILNTELDSNMKDELIIAFENGPMDENDDDDEED